MKKKRAVAPMIEQEAADFYAETFPSLNAGVTYVLDMVPGLYRQSMNEIRDILTPAELAIIQSAMIGYGPTKGSPSSMAGRYIDMAMMEHGDTVLAAKVGQLCRWHRVVLELWAASRI